MKSHRVRFWETRPNKTGKGTSYTVRWIVAGREKSATFARKAQADRYRSRLIQAADKGEAFDVDTGLPDSIAREVSSVTWYEHACAFADARWPRLAAKGRISLAEGLMAVTPVLVTSPWGSPDSEVLRQAMWRWAFNPPHRQSEKPAEIEAALSWLARASVPVAELQEASKVSRALDACGHKLDGSAAAPEYYRRRRRTFYGALNTRCERAIFRQIRSTGLTTRSGRPLRFPRRWTGAGSPTPSRCACSSRPSGPPVGRKARV